VLRSTLMNLPPTSIFRHNFAGPTPRSARLSHFCCRFSSYHLHSTLQSGHPPVQRTQGNSSSIKRLSNLEIEPVKVVSDKVVVRELDFTSDCELGLARAMVGRNLFQTCPSSCLGGYDPRIAAGGWARLAKIAFGTYSETPLFPLNQQRSARGEILDGALGVAGDHRSEIRFSRLRDVT
jgi:hypothetical protein